MSTIITRRALIAALAAATAITTALAQDAQAPTPSAKTAPVIVFAAASLKTALDSVGTQWTATNGTRVTFSYAASGALAKQIENGAPADLFVSADLKWMDLAAAKNLIKPESRVSLLSNALVLIAPADTTATLKIEPGFKLADAIGTGKLATGDPKSVPVGSYAQAALTNLGVWDAVSPKIAGTENVRAALAFVARGEAPFGIVYRTDAHAEPSVKIVDTFPADSHPPIIYPFALTASSKNPAAAEFLAFLKTTPATKIFQAEGFTVLP